MNYSEIGINRLIFFCSSILRILNLFLLLIDLFTIQILNLSYRSEWILTETGRYLQQLEFIYCAQGLHEYIFCSTRLDYCFGRREKLQKTLDSISVVDVLTF